MMVVDKEVDEKADKVVKTFKEVEDNGMDGGLESDSPMKVLVICVGHTASAPEWCERPAYNTTGVAWGCGAGSRTRCFAKISLTYCCLTGSLAMEE